MFLTYLRLRFFSPSCTFAPGHCWAVWFDWECICCSGVLVVNVFPWCAPTVLGVVYYFHVFEVNFLVIIWFKKHVSDVKFHQTLEKLSFSMILTGFYQTLIEISSKNTQKRSKMIRRHHRSATHKVSIFDHLSPKTKSDTDQIDVMWVEGMSEDT